MPQNPTQANVALNPSKAAAPMNLDAQGALIVSGTGGVSSTLNVSTLTAIKATPGRIIRFCVTTAGAAGTLSDCATTGAVAAANLICVVPATVGIYELDWPCAAGIVYTPGAAQVASFSWS